MRLESLPGLMLAATSTLCLFAAIATSGGPAPKTAPRRGTVSAAGTPIRVRTVTASVQDVRCLARAMWHEARGEPLEGRIAVAEVILARKGDRRFAPTVCGVVRQRSQFSFVRNGTIPTVPAEHAGEMSDLARKVLSGAVSSRAARSLWFHAARVSPVWRHDMRRVARIGDHVFYAEKA